MGRLGIQRASELNSASFMGMADGGPAEPSSPAPVIGPKTQLPKSWDWPKRRSQFGCAGPEAKNRQRPCRLMPGTFGWQKNHEIAGKRESDFAPLAPGWLV